MLFCSVGAAAGLINTTEIILHMQAPIEVPRKTMKPKASPAFQCDAISTEALRMLAGQTQAHRRADI